MPVGTLSTARPSRCGSVPHLTATRQGYLYRANFITCYQIKLLAVELTKNPIGYRILLNNSRKNGCLLILVHSTRGNKFKYLISILTQEIYKGNKINKQTNGLRNVPKKNKIFMILLKCSTLRFIIIPTYFRANNKNVKVTLFV